MIMFHGDPSGILFFWGGGRGRSPHKNSTSVAKMTNAVTLVNLSDRSWVLRVTHFQDSIESTGVCWHAALYIHAAARRGC